MAYSHAVDKQTIPFKSRLHNYLLKGAGLQNVELFSFIDFRRTTDSGW